MGEEQIKAVVLLSGGMDSTTCMALANQMNRDIYPVSINYGQKHVRELQAANDVAEHFGVLDKARHFRLEPSAFVGALHSSLVAAENLQSPQKTYEELAESVGPSSTYVPFRNGNLLSLATAHALSIGAGEIWFGAHAEDAHNWAYPDCTPEFIGAMASAIYIGSYMRVRLVTPLEWDTKADVIEKAKDSNAPLRLTWSCYEGGELSCGTCPTCLGRLNAFAQTNWRDPLEYAIEDRNRPDRGFPYFSHR